MRSNKSSARRAATARVYDASAAGKLDVDLRDALSASQHLEGMLPQHQRQQERGAVHLLRRIGVDLIEAITPSHAG